MPLILSPLCTRTILNPFGVSARKSAVTSDVGSSDEVVAQIALKEKRIVITFDKNFLKNKPADLSMVLFDFPRVPTEKISYRIENFLEDLEKKKLLQIGVLKFSKKGLQSI